MRLEPRRRARACRRGPGRSAPLAAACNALARACFAIAAGCLSAAAFAQGPQASAPTARAAVVRADDGVRWQNLTPAQRETLAPLERDWPGIEATRKQKWLALAARFRTLSVEERARITARMSEWARLTPLERGQARMQFEEVRQVPAPDRNARWQAYQALPADTRQQLAARAASAASGSREATSGRLGKAPRDAREAKSNVVPNPALAQPPKQVAPTLVQAGPGATTTLITRRPSPPAHQQSGMPKIAATPEFVHRSTLLPRRGPQAAAVAPASQSAPVARPAPLSAPPSSAQPVPARTATPARPAPAASTASTAPQ